MVQSTYLGEQFEVKVFFSKRQTNSFVGTWAKNFVLFLPKRSLNDYKKILVLLHPNTFNEVFFSGNLSSSLSYLDFVRENSGRVVKKCLCWQKINWGKWFFISNDLILDIVKSNWTKSFGFSLKLLNRDVNYCILRVGMNEFRKDFFFWKKLSVSISFRILRKKILDIQRKKVRTVLTGFERSGGKIWGKIFGIVTNLHSCSDCDRKTFESSSKDSLVGSPNCLVRIQTKNSKEVTFFRMFQFQIFFQFLSGKYPAVFSKPNSTRREERMENEF